MNSLSTRQTLTITPAGADKDTRYRLAKFEAYQADLLRPDLAAYRDHLTGAGFAPATVSAHLSTIRAAYRPLIRDRDLFYRHTPGELGAADRKAMVDEIIERLKNAIDPAAAPVKQTTRQDRPDSDHLRLTSDQAGALMRAPGLATLARLRDTAIIALMLCTGVREAELCALDVADLRERLGGELALHVREGKGSKERLIPYGSLSWVLVIVDRWLSLAEIDAGPVFRGLFKGERLRPGRLSVRAVQLILAAYPLSIEGRLTKVKPHDLRRTYARRLFDAGVKVEAIRQNLGHSDLKTTLGYVGELAADQRRPPAVYSFDLAGLK